MGQIFGGSSLTMSRTGISLVLLACLGFAILQLTTGEEEKQELEAASNEELQEQPDGVQIRGLREADADAKRRRKNKKRRNGKKSKKANKKKRKNRKAMRKQRKNKRKNKKRKNGKRSNGKKKNGRRNKSKRRNKGQRSNVVQKPELKQSACNVTGLCQKVKNYIKYSNQLRKLKRLNKSCEIMDNKKSKGEGGEFTASAEANADIDDANVTSIAEELKNCSTTIKENCETKAVNGCANGAVNVKCMGELEAWIAKFGPAKGSCLQASADCCSCINAISPDPSPECLDFDAVEKDAKSKKKTCTGSGTKGSFGYCRQLQQSAAEKGPAAAKTKCKSGGASASTSGSAGRRMLFRNNLLKKWIKA